MTRTALVLAALLAFAPPARGDFRELKAIPADAALASDLEKIAAEAFAAYPKLQPGHLSLTVVDLGGTMRRASFAPDVTYHPASVVKMFYLAATHHEASHGRVVIDEPLQAALQDMIVESSNDATSYVVDVITGTTSGPELSGRAWRRFVERRNAPNRWFHGMGYDLNANGKTWCEGVYGREKQLLGARRENRNRITSEGMAAMALWIARRRAVSAEASDAMLALMRRPLDEPGTSQVKEFGGEALPAGSKLWSKAGWTSEVRHDAMIVELPNGRRYVAAILTRGAADDLTLLPFLSKRIASLFQR